jgi:uncharacterized membrane protein YbhN (UPF0104 family)
MSLLEAHLLCIALVAVDLIARTWRFQWIVRGTRAPLSFRDAFVLNSVGDAAAALTPNRLGADPARLAGAVYAGVPLPAAVVAVFIELVVMWPVIIAAAGWLALIYAPRWWRTARPELAETAEHAWPWIIALLVVGVVAWILARRFFPSTSHAMQRGTRRALVYARRMPAWPLLASVPLTLLSLAARVAILPVLALTLPNPPAMGPLAFGSFALLYVQLLLPTPSGAGVIDIGFVGGAVGNLGEHHRSLLLIWRFYTTFVLIALGLTLALIEYGPAAVGAIVRGRAHRPTVARGKATEREY